jgi:hypothetical protein
MTVIVVILSQRDPPSGGLAAGMSAERHLVLTVSAGAADSLARR